jgi:hypothetical protein
LIALNLQSQTAISIIRLACECSWVRAPVGSDQRL